MITSADVLSAGLFSPADRCDRCGARAHVLVILTSGGELAFCEHHTRMHRAALEPIAVRFKHDSDPR